MKFTTKTQTIERTTVTVPVKDFLPTEQAEYYIEKYCIERSEFDSLVLEITADLVFKNGGKILEIWYGLKDYACRFYAFGTPEKSLVHLSVDACVAVTFNDYLDWDGMFGSMYADVD